MLLFLSVLASLAATLFIIAPFWRRDGMTAPPTTNPRFASPRQEASQRALRELEFDRATGKIDAQDYEQLQSHALAVPAGNAVARNGDVTERAWQRRRVGTEVEAEVLIVRTRRKMRRQSPLVPSTPVGNGSASAPNSSGWQCACGRSMDANDRFCASCGAPRPAGLEAGGVVST